MSENPSRAPGLYRQDEVILARKLNDAVRGVNRLSGQALGVQAVAPLSYPGNPPMWLEIDFFGIYGDYLDCVTPGDLAFIEVARPYMLRTSLTSHAGVTFTYPDEVTRIATSGADSETQKITPSYEELDIILAVRCGNPTGVSGFAPAWADLNVDARAWAAVPSA